MTPHFFQQIIRFFLKIFFTGIALFVIFFEKVFAQGKNLTGERPKTDTNAENLLGVSNNDLRSGNVDINTIPQVVATIIEFIISISGTISVLALIYCAIQIQLNSGVTGDSSGVDKYKKGIMAAILGFILSVSAWFLMGAIIRGLSLTSS